MKTATHWGKIGMQPHQGIAVPLFALHRDHGSGRGEFLDLIPLIQWCSEVGFDTLQLLPLYDTGGDPSPYNPISSCALDPLYLSLEETSFNKWDLLRSLYFKTLPEPDYFAFLENHPWVKPYALFRALWEAYGKTPWMQWGEDANGPTAAAFERHKETVDFYAYLQFLCFQQMRQVKAFAETCGVLLKGDLPILLSPLSADAWCHRNLFDSHLVAGAPPDAYNQLGQKWGFPLFLWETDHLFWWKERMKTISELYHLYRIDHVVGFFRIWAIPENKLAQEGFFIPADASLWGEQGRKHLEVLINASPALPMAEDLGTIPPEVQPILKSLGICGTKVIRWQRDNEGHYLPFDQYEPLSMTTLSTADMDPLPLWWRKFPDEAAPLAALKGWDYSPILSPDQHFQLLFDSMHTSSLFHINPLQEFLLLFPELSWDDLEKERINYPGTLNPQNWAYRFRPSLEQLISHEPLKQTIKRIIDG